MAETLGAKLRLRMKQLEEVKEGTNSESFKKSINDLKEDFQKQIDEAGVEIEKLGTTGGNTKTVTFKSLIAEALEHDDYKEFTDRVYLNI